MNLEEKTYKLCTNFFRDDLTENVRKYLLVGIMSKIVLKNTFLFILSDINFYDRLLSLLKKDLKLSGQIHLDDKDVLGVYMYIDELSEVLFLFVRCVK